MQTVQSQDGTTLAYDVYGRGPALIYITGASCFRSFLPIVQDAKAFAKEFTVYNYDRRGRGDSTDIQPYAIEREVEDIGLCPAGKPWPPLRQPWPTTLR